MLKLTLPFPPSVNTYWRTILRGRRPAAILSQRAREYKDEVLVAVKAQDAQKRFCGRLRVLVDLYPPTNRKFDIDNRPKGLFDAMAEAGVFEDDEQIDEMLVYKHAKDAANPRAEVVIEELSREASS